MDRHDMRILVVDDEKSITEAIQVHLEMEGYPVDVASTGETALELFRKNSHPVVMTDINMPSMGGMEVLKKIKSLRGETFVIMITAYTSLSKVLGCRSEGAMDYLLKPFRDLSELDEVIARAEQHLKRWDKVIQETDRTQSAGKP